MPRSTRKSWNKKKSFRVRLVSFGYKHGGKTASDLLFDVRFLPNPFYLADLRKYSGKTKKIQKYIFSRQSSLNFLEKMEDLLDVLIPEYIRKGKKSLVLAFGCTGGRHRSVAVVEILRRWVRQKGIPVTVTHRDEKG